jgi:small subunit ribosomal protein S18
MTAKKPAAKKKKARRAQEPTRLRNAKVSIEDIDYKNLPLLMRLLSAQGKLLSRKRTGLSAEKQRKAARALKRARQLALAPFVT